MLTLRWQAAHNIPAQIWWNNLERFRMAGDDLGCRDLLDWKERGLQPAHPHPAAALIQVCRTSPSESSIILQTSSKIIVARLPVS